MNYTDALTFLQYIPEEAIHEEYELEFGIRKYVPTVLPRYVCSTDGIDKYSLLLFIERKVHIKTQ